MLNKPTWPFAWWQPLRWLCSPADKPPRWTKSPTTAEAPGEVDTSPGEATTPVVHPFCDEIGRRVPVEQCEDFTHLADRAEAGVAAFNAPDPIRRGEAHTLQLAISDAPTPEEIAARERWEQEQQAAAAEAARLAAVDEGAFAQARATNTREAYERYLAERPDGRFVEEARAEVCPPTPALVAHAQPTQGEVVAETPATELPGEEPAPPAAEPPPPTPTDTVDPLQGETVEYAPLVGRFMRAELRAKGFEITPLTEASQEVLPRQRDHLELARRALQGGQRT